MHFTTYHHSPAGTQSAQFPNVGRQLPTHQCVRSVFRPRAQLSPAPRTGKDHPVTSTPTGYQHLPHCVIIMTSQSSPQPNFSSNMSQRGRDWDLITSRLTSHYSDSVNQAGRGAEHLFIFPLRSDDDNYNPPPGCEH